MTNPIPNNEKERLEALKSYHIMDSLSEIEFNAITKLAASICGVPIALISLLDENRQWFKAKFGINVDETPRNISFCQHAILDKTIFEVENALESNIFRENPLVTNDPSIRFYAGAPLIDPNGFNLGTLCVIDRQPKKLTEDQKEALEILASQAVALILLRKSKKDVEDSKNEIEAILSGLQEGIVFQNTEGEILRCNKSAEKILGLSYDQMIGKNSVDPSWRSIHEDGSDFPGNTHPAMVTLSTKEPLSDVIMGVHKPNNELTWISINSVPIFSAENKVLTGVICTFKDITETKLQNDKIKNNEQLLEKSQSIAKIGSWLFNLQTFELEWSKEHYKIFELENTPKDQLYEAYRSKIHPDDIAQLDAVVQRATEEGIGFEYHHRLITIDGTIKYVIGIGEIEKNKNNKPILIRGTVQDITETVLKDLKFATEEARWKFAIENSGDAIWDFNPITQKGYHSHKFFENIGYLPNEIEITQNFINSIIHPDDRAKIISKFDDLITGKIEYFTTEYRLKTKSGSYKWILDRAKVAERNSEGIATRMIGTHHDLTDRKKQESKILASEERLNEAQSLAKLGNWEFDLTTYNLFWSDELYSIFEIPKDTPTEKLYETYLSRFTKDDLVELNQRIQECQAKGTPYTFMHKIDVENADPKYVIGRGFARINEKGEIISLYGTAQDITEKYIAERELVNAKEKAELASIAKSDFLANMSHEIRTPLNGIIGFSDLLSATELDSTQEIFTKTIVKSSHSLLEIINDILDFSKIEAGKLELDIQKSDLSDIVYQAIDTVTFQAQKKELDLLMYIDPSLAAKYFVDPIRLKQILVNLLGNAIKFTEHGDVELRVERIITDNQKTKIRFSIIDSGVGIDKQHQTKIFEAFSQADNSTTRKFGGTGLGLSISNKLLDLMGNSTLQLKSQLGLGSTFFFEIDAAFEDESRGYNFRYGFSILVVNSSEKEARIIEKYLNYEELQTDLVYTSAAAFEKTENGNKYDAVLIDSKIYNTENNAELRKWINSAHFDILKTPIALITRSIHDDSYFKECEELGVGAKIKKPLKPSVLLESLSKLLIKQNTLDPPHPIQIRFEQKRTILIVDDNNINIMLANAILTNLLPNSTLINAENGKEAVEKHIEHRPDIIFMDVQMPILNGYEAAEEIRKTDTGKKIPIIGLTAGVIQGEKERCIAAGMDNYLSKPIIMEELIGLIQLYIN